MNGMNFELAHKQLAADCAVRRRGAPPAPAGPVHRPSVALILLATVIQIIAMAAVMGTVASAVQ
jgi:hypothetical protein